MYQPILGSQGSLGQEPVAKQVKMSLDDCAFKFSFQDLHNYLFEKQKCDENEVVLKIYGSENTNINSTNQVASNIKKDMPNMVRLCLSSIPGTGYGIQATQSIPMGAWIGPYQGNFVEPHEASCLADSSYLWEIFKDGRLCGYADGSDENTASWMRFIRCARHKQEQNLHAFQYMNKIYYRTYKTIEPGQELLVWYDDIYTQYLGIPCEGIYDMASANGTTHLPGTIVKVAEDKILTPPTTPTKNVGHPFNRQLLNPTTTSSKTPVCRNLTAMSKTTSPLPQDKMFELAVQDETIHNQNGTRKGAFDAQPMKVVEAQRSINQSAGVHAQTLCVPSTQALKSDSKMTSLKQSTSENTAALDALDHAPSLFQVKKPTSVGGTSPDVAQHQATATKAAEFQCGQCRKVFIQRSILQTHVCSSVLLKPYQCGHCNERFSSPGTMRLHAAAHQGNKPFKCGHCMRSLSGATTPNNHTRTHTGEKPFDCLRCGKTFTKGWQLSRHLKIPGDCLPRK